ncbi:MAG TPA: hypothetical protein VNL94_07355 [Candidatus Binatia bacterium]|nr:hypothetical protein [Candidatus Binatia bacterium]
MDRRDPVNLIVRDADRLDLRDAVNLVVRDADRLDRRDPVNESCGTRTAWTGGTRST